MQPKAHRDCEWPKVAIIVLNWNGWRDTVECLESVYQITYSNYSIILIDNGSEDESVEKIREFCEGKLKVESKFIKYDPRNKPIRIIEYTRKEAEAGSENEKEISELSLLNRKLILIKNESNYGFAEGNNIGMMYALKSLNPDYVLLLNNDTVVDRMFLVELVNMGELDAEIGLVGPKVYYYDFNGRRDVIHSAGAKINMNRGSAPLIGRNKIDKGQYDESFHADYLEGACILINRDTIQNIGMLNVKYFAYWEETDWCVRARNAGYRVIFAPKAKIWHKVARRGKNKIKTYYLAKNRLLFMNEHATGRQYLLFLSYFFGYHFWYQSGALLIYHKDMFAFISFLKGTMDGIRGFTIIRLCAAVSKSLASVINYIF